MIGLFDRMITLFTRIGANTVKLKTSQPIMSKILKRITNGHRMVRSKLRAGSPRI
jgi:hypothetical protein